MKFPYPGALTALQYFTSATGVLLCGQVGVLAHDPLDLRIMWQFLPAAIIFYLSLFTNNELLLHANVDTFIVFLSTVPIFVAIGKALYLHQPWPSFRCSPFAHLLLPPRNLGYMGQCSVAKRCTVEKQGFYLSRKGPKLMARLLYLLRLITMLACKVRFSSLLLLATVTALW
ncbi:hypothetical protein GIB67_021927 [Kingdonia uniflora]|uniref:Uncharacterized protein n=1 Tax=Kingdonia uniflora TaxID=39325 RepID=A0A7J7N4F5_9MAGN|nr:hypothetical protein GIB67_021927 [Kingdonia uniflora]